MLNMPFKLLVITVLVVTCICADKETEHYHNTFSCDDETDWNNTQSCDSVDKLMGYLEITVLEVLSCI